MPLIWLFLVLVAAGLASAFIFRNKIAGPPAGATDADIASLVKQGNLIQAIKWYRVLHNSSLKDAKAAIEKMRVS
jgi:ribosomal protein L7/L12